MMPPWLSVVVVVITWAMSLAMITYTARSYLERRRRRRISDHAWASFQSIISTSSTNQTMPYRSSVYNRPNSNWELWRLAKHPRLTETWSPEEVVAYKVMARKMGTPNTFRTPGSYAEPVDVEPHGEVIEAYCGADCEQVPGAPCKAPVAWGCGFYAFKTYQQALAHVRGGAGGLFTREIVRVKLSGRVIEHRKGYRAQFMAIDAVVPTDPLTTSIEAAQNCVCFACTQRAASCGCPICQEQRNEVNRRFRAEMARYDEMMRMWAADRAKRKEDQ